MIYEEYDFFGLIKSMLVAELFKVKFMQHASHLALDWFTKPNSLKKRLLIICY